MACPPWRPQDCTFSGVGHATVHGTCSRLGHLLPVSPTSHLPQPSVSAFMIPPQWGSVPPCWIGAITCSNDWSSFCGGQRDSTTRLFVEGNSSLMAADRHMSDSSQGLHTKRSCGCLEPLSTVTFCRNRLAWLNAASSWTTRQQKTMYLIMKHAPLCKLCRLPKPSSVLKLTGTGWSGCTCPSAGSWTTHLWGCWRMMFG